MSEHESWCQWHVEDHWDGRGKRCSRRASVSNGDIAVCWQHRNSLLGLVLSWINPPQSTPSYGGLTPDEISSIASRILECGRQTGGAWYGISGFINANPLVFAAVEKYLLEYESDEPLDGDSPLERLLDNLIQKRLTDRWCA